MTTEALSPAGDSTNDATAAGTRGSAVAPADRSGGTAVPDGNDVTKVTTDGATDATTDDVAATTDVTTKATTGDVADTTTDDATTATATEVTDDTTDATTDDTTNASTPHTTNPTTDGTTNEPTEATTNEPTEATTDDAGISARAAEFARLVGTMRAGGSSTESRRAIIKAAAEEMSFAPQDLAGAFQHWHRGALSLVHLNVLMLLQCSGPLPMRRLAEALDVSDASATGIIDRLERRGYIERRHGTEDRRTVLVHLTDSGNAVFRDMAERRMQHLTAILDELSEEEVGGLLLGLRALHAARERYRDRMAQLAAATANTAVTTETEPSPSTEPTAQHEATQA